MIQYPQRNWRAATFAITGTVLPRVLLRVILFTAFSAAVIGGIELAKIELRLNPIIHSLVGLALGLLLVFRTNASYDRYWDGRKCWSGIVGASRNLVRSASSFAGAAEELAPLVGAYAYALMQRLQRRSDDGATDNPPLGIAKKMTDWVKERLASGALPAPLARSLDVWIGQLMDHQGECERIRNTPMPFAYVVQIRQLLVVYLATLPLVLMGGLGWWSVPAMAFISFALLGIEEAGVEIEDPFGTDPNDLPIEELCATIQKDTAELAGIPKK